MNREGADEARTCRRMVRSFALRDIRDIAIGLVYPHHEPCTLAEHLQYSSKPKNEHILGAKSPNNIALVESPP